jgi:hypothetical protein
MITKWLLIGQARMAAFQRIGAGRGRPANLVTAFVGAAEALYDSR